MDLYGSVSLTKLGEIARKHPELVKKITFKDGHTEQFLDVVIRQKQDANAKFPYYGKASVKKDEQRQGLNYFFADLKESTYNNGQQGQTATQAMSQPQPNNQNATDQDALPF